MKKQKTEKKQNEVVSDLDAQNSALQKIIKAFKKSFNQSTTDGQGKKLILSILGLFIFLAVFCLDGNAVDNNHTVFASAGDCVKVSGSSLEWTLGETVITCFKANNFSVTQGFHQLGSITTSMLTKELPKLSVYPNPFTSTLTIQQFESVQPMNAEIVDITGCIVAQHSIRQANRTIELEYLIPGMYFLKIQNEDNSQTIKIIKK